MPNVNDNGITGFKQFYKFKIFWAEITKIKSPFWHLVVVVVVVGLPSFRPRFAGKCGQQSRDLTRDA